ncbi:MAG TPA: MBL fold metallo-hydrolase [Bryobacteraceae bacterium]|jgi:glyoxylase-like metal-dependent hydrolase (beta-lactamase superfamily II)
MHGRKSSSFGYATIASLSAFAAVALAQGPAPMPLMVHQLKPNVYWIEGGGGNSGVIIGDKGVIVVDAKTTPAAGKELLDDIAKITPKPVTTVIETHSDGDHVNGLASFPTGLTIIAHENNKKEQDAAAAAGGRGAPPAGHLPTQIISKDKDDLKIDGVKVQVLHWAPAHTSGDLVVYLPSEKIVFTGDIISTQPDALIHLEKNGSSEGWVKTAKGIAALDADQFVPGHGNVETKAEVQKRATDVAAKREKIKELVAQGKSLAEIKAAVGDPPPAQAKGGGRGGPAFASFTDVVYQELTKKP